MGIAAGGLCWVIYGVFLRRGLFADLGGVGGVVVGEDANDVETA